MAKDLFLLKIVVSRADQDRAIIMHYEPVVGVSYRAEDDEDKKYLPRNDKESARDL